MLTDRPTPGFENSEAGYAAYMQSRDDAAVCAVHVSEFMSSDTLYPLPDGAPADWIELHNAGDASFDLSGCALTDASDKLKYVFPDGKRIEAGEYLLLRCGEDGLGFSLRADGGETLWQLEDVALGASNSWATSSDGTIYIGGYYGPDPVAIDYLGHVIWQAESSDSYWLYHMEFTESEGKLTCWYDVMDGGERSGRVVYDLDGKVLQKYYD